MSSNSIPLQQLFASLADSHRSLAKALEIHDSAMHLKLSATETLLLDALAQRDRRAPSDLAAKLGLTAGRITHLVNALSAEEVGLVERVPDTFDRRRMLVALTAEGREAADVAHRRVQSLHGKLVATLGDAGAAMLDQQLSSVRGVADEAAEQA